MVDVDSRMSSLNPAHAAGLRRLSARAATVSSNTTTRTCPVRTGSLSLSSLAETVITHLRTIKIPVQPGLSDSEFAVAEAEFGFSFPPDLRAVLSLGLPVGPGFPDWRSPVQRHLLRTSLYFPIAAISCQISRTGFWPKRWGPRPSDPLRALHTARNALKKAPILIPIFDRCYIPSNPSLARNPIFSIDENRVLCCGSDISNFFFSTIVSGSSDLCIGRQISKAMPGRWIEFWSDVAFDRRSVSSPDRYFEIGSDRPTCRAKWVDGYLERIGSVLREAGWEEADVEEMIHVSSSDLMEGYLVDSRAVFDALLLKADRFSEWLRKAGWKIEEVSDALGFDFLRVRGRKTTDNLPPGMLDRIRRLAESVSRS